MESTQRIFAKILAKLDLPTTTKPATKENVVSKSQQGDVDTFKALIENNATAPLVTWGGTFDEAMFKEAREKIPDVLKDMQQEAKDKEIKAYFAGYQDVMKKFLERHVVVKATVKTMPFKTVYMHRAPKVFENKKQQLDINEKPVGFVVELPYQVERSTAYGEMKDGKPLFAPIIGNLDIDWQAPDKKSSPAEAEYIDDFSLQRAVFDAMDKQTTINSVWRYQNYGRKGEPICDKLMAIEDLMVSMERLASEVGSKSFEGNASICALIFAIDGRSIVAVIDYQGEQKNAFEALFKLTAYLEDAPRVAQAVIAPPAGAVGPGPVMGAGGQALPTWTEEELAQQPTFAPAGPSLPAWTEEELASRPDKFTGGDGVNLPVWTEEELAELAKQGATPGLNLPEWQDEGLIACPKCKYGCQREWEECPICSSKLK